jgi:hypothetical protein
MIRLPIFKLKSKNAEGKTEYVFQFIRACRGIKEGSKECIPE